MCNRFISLSPAARITANGCGLGGWPAPPCAVAVCCVRCSVWLLHTRNKQWRGHGGAATLAIRCNPAAVAARRLARIFAINAASGACAAAGAGRAAGPRAPRGVGKCPAPSCRVQASSRRRAHVFRVHPGPGRGQRRCALPDRAQCRIKCRFMNNRPGNNHE